MCIAEYTYFTRAHSFGARQILQGSHLRVAKAIGERMEEEEENEEDEEREKERGVGV